MTPEQREKIKQASLAADNIIDDGKALDYFQWLVTPSTVLSLIAQVEALTVPQWISVEDQVPEPEVDVLCFGPNKISVTLPWIIFVDWFGSKKDAGRGVTHWMPLPAAPQPQEKT